MKTIDLNSWTLLSERMASKNYISPDEKWMLKYYHSLSTDEISVLEKEQEMTEKVDALGIPTPKACGIVMIDGGGYGAMYENIVQKKSFSRAISEDPSRMPELMKKMVELGNCIHERKPELGIFPRMEDRIRENLPRCGVFSEEEMRKILAFMDTIPDTGTCLHGDFHPGNFITSPQGDYAIDLGMFCVGNPIYDWVQWYFLSHIIPSEAVRQTFHMEQDDVIRCWKLSLEYAFGYTGEAEIAAFEQKLEPFLAFASVAFLGIMPPVVPTLKMIKQTNSLFR